MALPQPLGAWDAVHDLGIDAEADRAGIPVGEHRPRARTAAVEDILGDCVELAGRHPGYGRATRGANSVGDHSSSSLEALKLLRTVYRHEIRLLGERRS